MEKLTADNFKRIFIERTLELVRKYAEKDSKRLKFNEIEFDETLGIEYELNRHIIFENCVFNKPILFKNRTKTSGTITFLNCRFLSGVSFEGGEFGGRITFEDCLMPESSLDFKGGDFLKELRIERGSYSSLNFFDGRFKEVTIGAYLHETFVKQVFINCTKFKGEISFYRLIGFEFDLRGVLNSDSYVLISESVFKHFVIAEFSNLGRLRFNRVSYNEATIKTPNLPDTERIVNEIIFDDKPRFSTFYIQNSVLDNVELFSVDFKSFGVISIRESSLNNIVVSNVVWPIKIFHFPLTARIDNTLLSKKLPLLPYDFRLIKENYRQLKYALSKQGDAVGEGYFHGLEMRALNKSLPWKTTWGTKLILKLSYLTSNYGQSIILPFVWLIGGHLFLFILGLIFNGFAPLHISVANPTIEGFEKGFEQFVIFLNPLHKSEELMKGYLIVVDVFMRIWSSYMIYNIVRASRRFIK